MEKTTIQVGKDTLGKLKEIRRHPNESYDQTINFLVEGFEEELSPEEIGEIEGILKKIKEKGIDKTTFTIEEVAKELNIDLEK
jgi:predicted transposase YdaD